MNWNYGSLLILLSLAISCKDSDRTDPPTRPNFVMILGDDLGYPYYGFMGDEVVLTPNLDKLAEQGILFPQTHVTASVCLPSLVSLLTGQYPIRYNYQLEQYRSQSNEKFHQVTFDSIEATTGREHVAYPIEHFKTLPEYLSELGYASFQGGKYWEGPYDRAGFTHGMTTSIGPEEIAEHGAIYAAAGGDGLSLGRESNAPVYQFIEEHLDQPFYVWYAPMLPHTPHDPPDEFMAMYDGQGLSLATQKYYANITRLDRRIGELVQYLDSTGLRNNTIVFYLAENGYEQEPGDEFHPMGQRRGKGSMHEMGFRTPLLFSWPEVIPMSEINRGLVSAVDIFPTILDFAGADIPEGLPGKSILDNVLENMPTDRDTLFGSMNQLRIGPGNPATGSNPFANEETSLYLTTSTWHFIYYEDRDSLALYDRQNDPEEVKNLARQYPELAERFKQETLHWKGRQLSH